MKKQLILAVFSTFTFSHGVDMFFIKFLLTAIFSSLALVVDANALEIWRNQQRYDIDVRLPKGSAFQHVGVDRKFSQNGISGNLRLIQDNYDSCAQLIGERQVNRAKDGFTAVSDRKAARRDCAITLANPATGQMMTSNYIWLDICKCFAAVHFTYGKQAAGALARLSKPLLSSLRAGASARDESPPLAKAGSASSAVAEAIAILKERGFPSQRVAQFIPHNQHDLVDAAYGLTRGTATEQQYSYGPGDYEFDVETGRHLGKVSLKEFARSISSCYRNDKYWKHCQLNYHQEMGCRMTTNWRRVCRNYDENADRGAYIGDLCFWEPKGDLPILPAKADAEKTVQLPKVADAKTSGTRKSNTQKKKAALPQRPLCQEDLWPDVFGGK